MKREVKGRRETGKGCVDRESREYDRCYMLYVRVRTAFLSHSDSDARTPPRTTEAVP